MPFKDPLREKENSKERQRRYRAKPGILDRMKERMHQLRKDLAYVAGERAQQKVSRANPETRPSRLARDRARHNKLRQFFNLLKMERPCYDCGGSFPPEAIDWDHLPGTEKCFNIGSEMTCHPMQEVISEINKCQLVCATCHRIRTMNRKQEGK